MLMERLKDSTLTISQMTHHLSWTSNSRLTMPLNAQKYSMTGWCTNLLTMFQMTLCWRWVKISDFRMLTSILCQVITSSATGMKTSSHSPTSSSSTLHLRCSLILSQSRKSSGLPSTMMGSHTLTMMLLIGLAISALAPMTRSTCVMLATPSIAQVSSLHFLLLTWRLLMTNLLKLLTPRAWWWTLLVLCNIMTLSQALEDNTLLMIMSTWFLKELAPLTQCMQTSSMFWPKVLVLKGLSGPGVRDRTVLGLIAQSQLIASQLTSRWFWPHTTLLTSWWRLWSWKCLMTSSKFRSSKELLGLTWTPVWFAMSSRLSSSLQRLWATVACSSNKQSCPVKSVSSNFPMTRQSKTNALLMLHLLLRRLNSSFSKCHLKTAKYFLTYLIRSLKKRTLLGLAFSIGKDTNSKTLMTTSLLVFIFLDRLKVSTNPLFTLKPQSLSSSPALAKTCSLSGSQVLTRLRVMLL